MQGNFSNGSPQSTEGLPRGPSNLSEQPPLLSREKSSFSLDGEFVPSPSSDENELTPSAVLGATSLASSSSMKQAEVKRIDQRLEKLKYSNGGSDGGETKENDPQELVDALTLRLAEANEKLLQYQLQWKKEKQELEKKHLAELARVRSESQAVVDDSLQAVSKSHHEVTQLQRVQHEKVLKERIEELKDKHIIELSSLKEENEHLRKTLSESQAQRKIEADEWFSTEKKWRESQLETQQDHEKKREFAVKTAVETLKVQLLDEKKKVEDATEAHRNASREIKTMKRAHAETLRSAGEVRDEVEKARAEAEAARDDALRKLMLAEKNAQRSEREKLQSEKILLSTFSEAKRKSHADFTKLKKSVDAQISEAVEEALRGQSDSLSRAQQEVEGYQSRISELESQLRNSDEIAKKKVNDAIVEERARFSAEKEEIKSKIEEEANAKISASQAEAKASQFAAEAAIRQRAEVERLTLRVIEQGARERLQLVTEAAAREKAVVADAEKRFAEASSRIHDSINDKVNRLVSEAREDMEDTERNLRETLVAESEARVQSLEEKHEAELAESLTAIRLESAQEKERALEELKARFDGQMSAATEEHRKVLETRISTLKATISEAEKERNKVTQLMDMKLAQQSEMHEREQRRLQLNHEKEMDAREVALQEAHDVEKKQLEEHWKRMNSAALQDQEIHFRRAKTAALEKQKRTSVLARNQSRSEREMKHMRQMISERSETAQKFMRQRAIANWNSAFIAMVEGSFVHKFSENYTRQPDDRWIALNSDRSAVGWCKSKYADARKFTTTVQVNKIEAVFFGKRTPAFVERQSWSMQSNAGRNVTPWRCFSFRTNSRNYNFIAVDESGDSALQWVLGLQRLAKIDASRCHTMLQLKFVRAKMRIRLRAEKSGVPFTKVLIEAMFGSQIAKAVDRRMRSYGK